MTPTATMTRKRGRPRKHENALNATSGRKRGRTLYSRWECFEGDREYLYLYEGLRPKQPEGYPTPGCPACGKPMRMVGLFFVGPDRRTRALCFVPAEAYLDQYDKWRMKVFHRYYRGDLCRCGHFEMEHVSGDLDAACNHMDTRTKQLCSCAGFSPQKDDPDRIAAFTAPPDSDVPF